jgi:DNA-binding SARP family transcriptional activator
MNVIRFEPLRESAERFLMGAHLAEHNHVEAVRAFRQCERLVGEELGITPSCELYSLVNPIGDGPVTAPPASLSG